MSTSELEPALEVQVHLGPEYRREALIHDVRTSLTSTPKSLPPTWFYDARGSELFEEITRLPEYYPTRAERSILLGHAREIIQTAKADSLIELGSGSSEKTRILLDAMCETQTLERFVPFDVSESILRSAAAEINRDYHIPVTAVVGDFHLHLPQIPQVGRRLIVFLGGTIGNLTPSQRHRFLVDLEATMGQDDWLLLGTDLEKDVDRLIAAYDDSAGVTAEFNKNLLAVLNNELGADFDLSGFDHVALWNSEAHWIEMRLRSKREQVVTFKEIELAVAFAEGEDLLTEISSKFTTERVKEELEAANFIIGGSWTDGNGDFLLTLAHPYC